MLLLTGCTQPDNRITVKFASWGSKSEIEIIKPLIAEFEMQNPDIKTDFIHIPQNYFQKIHLMLASNTAPDVIFINNLYLPVYSGQLTELDKPENIFYPQALEALSRDGKLYAIPRDISNMVIYYNKDIFDRNHVPYPQDNWTFDEFLKTAQKLTNRPNTFGVSFEEDSLYYLPFLMSEGGGIFNIESSGSQKGLNFYADLRKKYHAAPMKNESASATMAQMFLQGRLAMHLSGRWLVPKYRQEAHFDWDAARFPRGSKGSIVPADASGWAIVKSTKHPQEAKKLVEFLSSHDSIVKFTQSGLIVPARKDAAKDLIDGKRPYNAQVFIKTAETSKPTPVSQNYNEVLDKLKQKLELKFN
jgi:multiple sugar transport system substrate-binding protein